MNKQIIFHEISIKFAIMKTTTNIITDNSIVSNSPRNKYNFERIGKPQHESFKTI